MARTALLYLLPAFLIATYWARLERDGGAEGRFLWIAALALAPALVRPLWARAAALLLAAALAVRTAFELSLLDARPFREEDFFGPLGSRFWNGFSAFFEVAVPFRPGDQPGMHGVILLAVFGFCVVLGLAIATRRPLLASAALIAGAGWPATILNSDADLARGAVVLAAALLLFAGMRTLPTLDLRQPLLAGGAIVVAALVLSTSPSVARGEFVDGWREWDVQGAGEASLGVEYVWNANYAGIRFPDTPTTVLTIRAREEAGVYWRATTLDGFERGRWVEQLFAGAEPVEDDGVDDLSDDAYLPDEASDRENWIRADVTVEALRDNHLVGASVPVAYDTNGLDPVYFGGNVALVEGGTDRGDSYTVYSYAPQPGPRELAASKPSYPDYLSHLFLQIEGISMPPFGQPGREAEVQEILDRDPRVGAYGEVYRQARDLVGTARSPYAAAVALESWFRGGGDFLYDEQPPRGRGGTPALVAFVTATKRGYCQHFAGAMALMLRQLGIPARVAAGFTSGRYDRDAGHWVVADRNAHTWVEAWFAGFGWLPFDPTPGRGTLGATYTSSSPRFDVGGAQRALGAASAGISALLRGEGGGPDQDRPRGADPGGARPVLPGNDTGGRGMGILTLLLALGLAAAVLLAAAKVARRGLRFLTRDPRGLAGAVRRDLVGFIADQGVPVPESATPAELGRILERQFGVDAARLVESLTLARFGPPEVADEAAARARRDLRRVRKALRARLTVPRRARGLVSARSLAV